MKFGYGVSAPLWCACADYVENIQGGFGGDAHQLLRAAVNVPGRDILNAAEAHILPLPGVPPDEQRRNSELLGRLAPLALLLICPLELSDLHREIARRWGNVCRKIPPSQRKLDDLKNENLWTPYKEEAADWFTEHEREITKLFSDWSQENGAPDADSNFDTLVGSLCAIGGRPTSPRPGT